MSNYRNHALFSILVALPFALSPFYLFFSLLGASICDMDHSNNESKVVRMMLFALLLAVLLFFVDGLSISALILFLLAAIFYLSRHRGFTHTVFGIVVLSFLFLLMLMGFFPVFVRLCTLAGVSLSSSLLLFVIMAVMGYFLVNRRFYLIYLLVLAVYLFLSPVDYMGIDWLAVLFMLLLGSFSHIVLDLLTPAGLKLFSPLWGVTFYRSLGLFLFVVWVFASVYVVCFYGCWITSFTPILR